MDEVKKRLLWIDSLVDYTADYRQALRQNGYFIGVSEDAYEAIEKATYRFDGIFLRPRLELGTARSDGTYQIGPPKVTDLDQDFYSAGFWVHKSIRNAGQNQTAPIFFLTSLPKGDINRERLELVAAYDRFAKMIGMKEINPDALVKIVRGMIK